jgi:hypothetical protein
MKPLYIIASLLLLFFTGCGTSGQFVVKSEPAGAEILVDGKPMGRTPATVSILFLENKQLVTEKKIITLRLKGYREVKEVLSYQGNNSQLLNFRLEPLPSGS